MKLPLSLSLHPSRSATAALIAIHGLAVVAIAISQIAMGLKALALVALGLSLAHALRRHAWHSGAGAIVALRPGRDGNIELQYGNDRRINARIDASSTVLHWMMALRLRHEDGAAFLLLLPDMLDRESWRRLSVLLRVAKSAD